jgi:uncharacterized protein YecT (DUF1311 family)
MLKTRLLRLELIGSLTAISVVALTGDAVAQSQIRTLQAFGQGPAVMVTDCPNCGDDAGIIMECKNNGGFAQIEVPWAAMRDGVEGAGAPVVFQISGRTYSYPARTVHQGQIGYIPSFTIKYGDPLLVAMQSAAQAAVRFGGANTTISLQGGGPAINAFIANCWGQNGGAQVGIDVPRPPQQQPQALAYGGPAELAAPATRPAWCASSANLNAAEATVCATPQLWQVDNQLGQTYREAMFEFEGIERKFGVQGQAAKLKAQQADWLRVVRNGCQTDAACLDAAYRRRIEEVAPRGD